jgi:fumarylacetoacetase
MTFDLNETHNPSARSFVESANVVGCDFPIQNLPFGAFAVADQSCTKLCVAIGDQVFDLHTAVERRLLDVDDSTCEALQEPCLNPLMGLGPARWHAVRKAIFELLLTDSKQRDAAVGCLLPQRDVTLVLPVAVHDYTDFYASVHHAQNVGALFRPDNPLLPNYKWVPIGYHGRASSIVISGTDVRRPLGQLMAPQSDAPTFSPSRRLDYELEVGAFVGVGNQLGEPIPISQASGHLFGLCLLNDWSARDVQTWEYQPLGPFLAKSFATSLSPWVITTEALAPYRLASTRPEGDPLPLAYLSCAEDQQRGAFDITVEVCLRSKKMREAGCAPHLVSRGNLRDMYWTFAQMLAHHSSNGCNLRPGDLLGSGTISGPAPDARGCLLELSRGGAEPLLLPDGTQRTFLEDGDEVIMRGRCARAGAARIGLGECRGIVLPARSIE